MQELLKKYAKLLVEVGVNIQNGQALIVRCPVECADLARACVEAAYNAGCSEAMVDWRDGFCTRQKYLYADSAVFETIPEWRCRFSIDNARQGTAIISITGDDPENLKGVDPERLMASGRAAAKQLAEFTRLQVTDSFAWCVAGAATEAWANKVFPGCPDSVDRLWKAIFKTALVDEDSDPVVLWREKQKIFDRRMNYLNSRRYKALHYKNSLGTDVTVGLPDDHVWMGCSSIVKNKGTVFLPNIPTEEIFTAPHKDKVNGVICSSMPLIENGDIADKFSFTLKDGKIVDVKAEKGLELLLASLDTDEGARYLGEVALVPCDSAISTMDIQFYNTLYDENASCHFAFGAAYPDCIKGGSDMTESELAVVGGNTSGVHSDFMVGTADLSIDGINADGTSEPLFREGKFVF